MSAIVAKRGNKTCAFGHAYGRIQAKINDQETEVLSDTSDFWDRKGSGRKNNASFINIARGFR